MKQIKNAVSKISTHHTDESTTSTKEDGAAFNDEEVTHVWTVGEEFQFYVPWLWEEEKTQDAVPAKQTPDSLPEEQTPDLLPDKLHPNRQVVRITRPTVFPGLTEELQDACIRSRVAEKIRDLVNDEARFPTRTESQLGTAGVEQTKAWKDFNIVQRNCDLPKVSIPEYEGVCPVEMTIVINKISIRKDQATPPCVGWLDLPSPGQCIERINNQVRIHLTSDCSLHTHIRPMTTPVFELKYLKKLASLLWLAEDRLNKLYDPARNKMDSPLHRSLRRCSNLALEERSLVTGDLDEYAAVLGPLDIPTPEKAKLATIWQAADHHQLRALLRIHPSIGKHDYPAYNFFNLFNASEKQTIEFRKTESTTDGQVIDAWIEVFVLLADFSVTSSTEAFQRVMERLGKNQDAYSTWKLLEDVGCRKPVAEVLKRKFVQPLGSSDELGESSVSRAAESPSSGRRGSNSASRTHLRDSIRERAVKLGGKIAEGYSYSG